MILPPQTIGILGGGQLARMIAMAGRRMGFHFIVYEPAAECPAEGVCDSRFNASFEDEESLATFASQISACTVEFENVPVATAEFIADRVPFSPGVAILKTCQSRRLEKEFLRANGFPCVPFEVVESEAGLRTAVQKLGYPSVLKSAYFGYDGKGQIRLRTPEDCQTAWARLGVASGVLESWITHSGEFSIIVARDKLGHKSAFPAVENLHVNHILHTSIMPAQIGEKEAEELEEIAFGIADAFEMVGLAAVEFFRTDSGWMVNEIAPRPHNSGHLTFDACMTSQFEQCVRATCGLPFGDTKLMQHGIMMNLMGDLWHPDTPDWNELLNHPNLKLHLYGKKHAKPGRKMGHLTILDSNLDPALKLCWQLELRLMGSALSERE